MYTIKDAREAWGNVEQGNASLGIDFGLNNWHTFISDWTTSIKSLGAVIQEEELGKSIIDGFAPFMDATAEYSVIISSSNPPANSTTTVQNQLSNFSKLTFSTNVPVEVGDTVSQVVNEDGDIASGTVFDVKDNTVVLWPSTADQDSGDPILFTTLVSFPVFIAGTSYTITNIIDSIRNKTEIDALVATATTGLGNIQDDFVNDYGVLKTELDKIPPLLREASIAMSFKDSPMLQSPGVNGVIGQLSQVESDDPADFAKKVMGGEGKAVLDSAKIAWDTLVQNFNRNTDLVAPESGTSELTTTLNTLEGYLNA